MTERKRKNEKKILTMALFLAFTAALMIAEYRFIMENLEVYVTADAVFVEILEQTDEYELEMK